MPYIPEEAREEIKGQVVVQSRRVPNNSGELNFSITSIILEYLERQGLYYQTLNDITGALGEVAAEFRRRIIVPYEEAKIVENGDVYPDLSALAEAVRSIHGTD